MAIRSKTQVRENARPIVCTQDEYQGRPTFAIGIEGGNPQYNLSAGVAKWSRLFAMDIDGDSVLMNTLDFVLANCEDHEDAHKVMHGVNAFISAFQAKWGTTEEVEEELAEEQALAPVIPPDLCVRCGSPADDKTGLIMCSSCRNHHAQQMAAKPVGPVIRTTTPIAPVPLAQEPSPAQVEETEEEGPTEEQAAKLGRMLKSQTAFYRKLTTQEQREFLVRDAWLMTVIGGISWEEYRDSLKAWVADPMAYLSENGFEG